MIYTFIAAIIYTVREFLIFVETELMMILNELQMILNELNTLFGITTYV